MIINLSGTALADGQPVSEPVELVFCLDVQLAIVGQQRRQQRLKPLKPALTIRRIEEQLIEFATPLSYPA